MPSTLSIVHRQSGYRRLGKATQHRTVVSTPESLPRRHVTNRSTPNDLHFSPHRSPAIEDIVRRSNSSGDAVCRSCEWPFRCWPITKRVDARRRARPHAGVTPTRPESAPPSRPRRRAGPAHGVGHARPSTAPEAATPGPRGEAVVHPARTSWRRPARHVARVDIVPISVSVSRALI